MALLFALDQADAALVQLPEQPGGLVLAAAHQRHGVLLGKVDVDTAVLVHPPVADRQAHAVQQEAIEDLGLDGNSLVAGIGEQGLGDAVKAVLFGFGAVVTGALMLLPLVDLSRNAKKPPCNRFLVSCRGALIVG